MDLRLRGRRYQFRLVRTPDTVDAATQVQIEALVRDHIIEAGFEVSESVLDSYVAYPVVTLAYLNGKLAGYHGMSIRAIEGRWLVNLGSLYVRPGERRYLGQALMSLSALPALVAHPRWPLLFYTLTRSPRVVASGRRWLDPFYPHPPDLPPPPDDLLGPVLADLAERGEALEDERLLTLPPPAGGWKPVPLPPKAWSGEPAVDAYVRQALGPAGDRRILVLGQVSAAGVARVLARGTLGFDPVLALARTLDRLSGVPSRDVEEEA